MVHYGVTRAPTDAWVAQMEQSAILRETTPYGVVPRFLIRDNGSKFGTGFKRVAAGSGIEVLRTPFKTPRANAACERFLESVRRECLNNFLILSERHLHKVIKEYVQYFNEVRPHQGIHQAVPVPNVPHPQTAGLPEALASPTEVGGKVISFPVLGGLHHDYRRAA